MGQYYKPTILGKNKKTVIGWMYSHTYGELMGGFCGLKLMEHSWLKNEFVGAFESLLLNKPQRVVWAGDYADHCTGRKSNLYDRCTEKNEIKPEKVPPTIVKANYIVNHTTKQFVDKTKLIDKDGWVVHPLPLLTSEGNERGGGDYHPHNDKERDLIGSWARHLISVETKKPKGYTELVVPFYEEW